MNSTQVALRRGTGVVEEEEVAEVAIVLSPEHLAHLQALDREKTCQFFRNLVYMQGRPVSIDLVLFVCHLFVFVILCNCFSSGGWHQGLCRGVLRRPRLLPRARHPTLQ